MAALIVTLNTEAVVDQRVNAAGSYVVNVAPNTFSVYVRVTRAGTVFGEWKVRFDAGDVTIAVERNDLVTAIPAGTGVIQVTKV